jgi:hypothetical protein
MHLNYYCFDRHGEWDVPNITECMVEKMTWNLDWKI